MRLLVLFVFVSGLTFAQDGAATKICNSTPTEIIKSKSLSYDASSNFYYAKGEYGFTDILKIKDKKVDNYVKIYHFLTEEKMRKALNIFIDDTFEKSEKYANEDYLDAELWISETNQIAVFYTPKENSELNIVLSCLTMKKNEPIKRGP